MKALITLLTFAVILLGATIASLINVWLGIVVGIFLTVSFLRNAIYFVPKNPPHVAVLSYLGRRQKIILKEGFCFLPLRPFFFDIVLIKIEKVNYDFEPQEVRTPDRAQISVKASITWQPGIDLNAEKLELGKDPESYITYLDSGGENGVRKIIHDIVEDRIKTWAASNREGPSTWEEAQALKDDAHGVLVKALLREALGEIDSKIPTSVLMKFFDYPQSEPSSYDIKSGWGFKDPVTGEYNWDGLEDYFKDPAYKEKVSEAIEERRERIKEIREGRGRFGDKGLGITIVRFSVNEVRVTGEVAKAAEQEEKERNQRLADKQEIENVFERAQLLTGQVKPAVSPEDAYNVIQVERGKSSKVIVQVQGAATGLGQDAIAAAFINQGSMNKGGTPGEEKKKDSDEMSPEEKKASLERYKKEKEDLRKRIEDTEKKK